MRTTTITSNIIIISRCRLIIILSSGDPRRDCTTTCSYNDIVIAEFSVTRSAADRCSSKRFVDTSGRDLGPYSAIERIFQSLDLPGEDTRDAT